MIYIYGAGGHGKVVFYSFKSINVSPQAFIDDKTFDSWCGIPVLKPDMLSGKSFSIHFAIGKNLIRKSLQLSWQAKGYNAETIAHIKSMQYPNAVVGQGSFLAAGSILGVDSSLGLGCILNHNAVVDHDCQVGDFTHIAPNATLGGGVSVGSLCLIGAGAVVLPGLTVGDNVVVGAGAVVIKNIPCGSVVVGNPSKPLIRLLK